MANAKVRENAPALAVALAIGIPVSLPAAAQNVIHDDQIFVFFQAEELEYREGDGEQSYNWDAQGWVGEDFNKLWFKTEGEKIDGGEFEEIEVQLLYSRLLTPFFDVQAGLRYDFEPEPERAYAVFGLQGLAEYYFEIDSAVFISDEGEVSGRVEAEYELLLTQRLVLQPSIEVNLSAEDVEERGIGSGLNDIELGLRLRYEFAREFAPYIGVNWERQYGNTADFSRDEGEDIEHTTFVAGIRFWF